MNSIEFETELALRRQELYQHPTIDIINQGFRPVSGMPADFCVIQGGGRYHFFYIERRLQEGTPFFPGNEIYFGHASTADLATWEVHDPVLLIRPGTWEGAHVWAPFVLRHQGRYVMAYTGVNRCMSQDIGLAVSDDLFDWKRLDRNPLSPAKDRPWAFWREDGIASCRDPHLLAHDHRVWMTYTANTREGASCVALASSSDLVAWEDHGPILQGPTDGYQVVTSRENPFGRGRPQGQLESSHLLSKNGRWYLLVQAHMAWSPVRNWIMESARLDAFDLAQGREFWPNAYTVEVVRERGARSLLACTGPIRFGVVDWSQEQPVGRFIDTREELASWLD
ncbi:MAG: hypothetical protein GXY76_05380 [Chloroflexi bacterium]|nr:hypothetical protein [Chloroflexota bacterium]